MNRDDVKLVLLIIAWVMVCAAIATLFGVGQ